VGLVVDAGALIAFERGDRHVAALLEATRRRKDRTVTSSGCVAQAWRGPGSRQALLARLLLGITEHSLNPDISEAVGELCAATRTSDVIDAHLALLAHDHDIVLTSDAKDLRTLRRAAGTTAHVKPC